jgi:hypothetical protein
VNPTCGAPTFNTNTKVEAKVEAKVETKIETKTERPAFPNHGAPTRIAEACAGVNHSPTFI